jgi:murein L,D-transpeptidase YafK
MRVPLLRLFGLVMVVFAVLALAGCSSLLPKTSPLRSKQNLTQATMNRLGQIGSTPGAAMMIRIFKATSEFEVWKQAGGGEFKLYQTYKICAYSGGLGPKIKEGDRQAPEGFYNITPGLMNPNSNYYLAFNTGFPNKFDRAWGRTGANLMVHGDCSSSGCYSMTDASIAEIYALARESFAGGNAVVQMQIFPFRMTPKAMAEHASDPNMPFWKDIKEGYDRFELTHTPPAWDVCEKKYVFDLNAGTGALDASASCPARGNDVLLAALKAKQSSDDAQTKIEVAALADRQAKLEAATQAEVDSDAAAKARGNAIGGFIGGLFGGGQAQPVPTIVPGAVAPTPLPAPARG